MNKKFEWKALDVKVAELCKSSDLQIKDIAQQLSASTQTIQRSMRRQGINRNRRAAFRG